MLKEVVRGVLEHPERYDWTLQGLGMLRMYFSPAVRLHVWSPDHVTPGVTMAHSHPWDFESEVVAGCLRNIRLDEDEGGVTFNAQVIKCGAGAYTVGEPELRRFSSGKPEIYRAGDRYQQRAEEIHYTLPDPGTVSIIQRYFGADRDHATILWPEGEEWVSAEPRPATPDEVRQITQTALEKWFNGPQPEAAR